MANLLLNQDDLEQLTGFKRHNQQVIELRRLGIEHRVRGDGMPLVSRRAFEIAMGGEPANDAGGWELDLSKV